MFGKGAFLEELSTKKIPPFSLVPNKNHTKLIRLQDTDVHTCIQTN